MVICNLRLRCQLPRCVAATQGADTAATAPPVARHSVAPPAWPDRHHAAIGRGHPHAARPDPRRVGDDAERNRQTIRRRHDAARGRHPGECAGRSRRRIPRSRPGGRSRTWWPRRGLLRRHCACGARIRTRECCVPLRAADRRARYERGGPVASRSAHWLTWEGPAGTGSMAFAAPNTGRA